MSGSTELEERKKWVVRMRILCDRAQESGDDGEVMERQWRVSLWGSRLWCSRLL